MHNCTPGKPFRVLCIVSVARNFLPGWVASPPRNPPPLSWLGTGADFARRFYMQNLWRSTYIYIHTYTCIHIHAYIYIHTYTSIYTYTSVCMYASILCMYVCTHICIIMPKYVNIYDCI